MTLNERLDTEARGRVPPRERIVVSEPTVTRLGSLAHIECSLGEKRALRVSVRGPHDLIEGIRPDATAFLPVAVLIAGHEGKDIECRAALDPNYALGLNANFAPLMAAFFQHHCVKVFDGRGGEPDVIAPPRSARSGLLFSAGVDSFYSLVKMRSFGARPDYLINVNAGGHRNSASEERRRANVAEVAAKLDVPLALVDTNFHELFVEQHIKCHPIRHLCGSFALGGWIGALYYSGGNAYHDISFAEAARTGDISYIEPVESAGMAPPNLKVLYLGCDAERVEKTRAIGTYPLAQAHLDVCFDAAYQERRGPGAPMNCGQCMKCIRTIITLDHFGYLDAFESRFDLAPYRRNRRALIDHLLSSGKRLNYEAAVLAGTPKSKLLIWKARWALRAMPLLGLALADLARLWRRTHSA